jgi:hypothetical protein
MCRTAEMQPTTAMTCSADCNKRIVPRMIVSTYGRDDYEIIMHAAFYLDVAPLTLPACNINIWVPWLAVVTSNSTMQSAHGLNTYSILPLPSQFG